MGITGFANLFFASLQPGFEQDRNIVAKDEI
jgi:hypothetical protein